MNDKIFSADTPERNRQFAVAQLAQSLHHHPGAVNTLYGMVLRHYTRTARIKNFLSALVAKRVKDVLRDDTPTSDIESRRGRSREL